MWMRQGAVQLQGRLSFALVMTAILRCWERYFKEDVETAFGGGVKRVRQMSGR